MAAILQLAVHIYHQELRFENPDWESIRAEVLEELGLSEESLPELVDIVRERYHTASAG